MRLAWEKRFKDITYVAAVSRDTLKVFLNMLTKGNFPDRANRRPNRREIIRYIRDISNLKVADDVEPVYINL